MGGDHLWDAIGATGEWAGAIAVVATLGYLAVQIRQNASSMRSSAELEEKWSPDFEQRRKV